MTEILKAEFRRTAWVLVLALGAILLSAARLSAELELCFMSLVNNNGEYIHHVSEGSRFLFVLPNLCAGVLIALLQCRDKRREFWRGLPYSSNTLYAYRNLYGIMLFAAVCLVKLAVMLVLRSKYAPVYDEFVFFGYTNASLASLMWDMLITICYYVVCFAVLKLVNRAFVAAMAMFCITLLPFVFGFLLPDFVVYTLFDYILIVKLAGVVFAVLMFYAGMYAERRYELFATKRIFAGKATLVVFWVVCVLFAVGVVCVWRCVLC